MLRSSVILFIVASVFTFKISSDELNIANLGKHSHSDEKKCTQGPTGPQGFNGLNGLNGLTGATGPTGPGAPGFIIPFASGRFISLEAPTITTLSDGTPGFGVMLDFGGAAQTPVILGADLNLSTFGSFSYTMPRDGTLTAIAATFSADAIAVFRGYSVTVHAQIWTTGPGSNFFTPLTGATVTLSPAYAGVIVPSVVSDGIISGLNIPLPAQTRVMLVFYADAAGIVEDLSGTLRGSMSAGLLIE